MLKCCAKVEPERLSPYIRKKNWKETMRVLTTEGNDTSFIRDQISTYEIEILWTDAPLQVVRCMLRIWPEICNEKGWTYGNLLQRKLQSNEWTVVRSILKEYPNIVSSADIELAIDHGNVPPLDVYESMLDRQPNAPLERQTIVFSLIDYDKLDHFRAVLKRCPSAAEIKDGTLKLTPLLMIFQRQSRMNVHWIGAVLSANPDAARQRDYDGKTPLHLANQHDASEEIITMIRRAYPEAQHTKDNLGRTPTELSHRSGKAIFTPLHEALILTDEAQASIQQHPENAVVMCRGDLLMRDLSLAQNEDEDIGIPYGRQVLTRHSIFETLLDEFSKMVGVDDKDVIQKAAAVQALAVQLLSFRDDTVVDFSLFENPGYWYQQEVLKLVMRVYHACLWNVASVFPSMQKDAEVCFKHLKWTKAGKTLPKLGSDKTKPFYDLAAWLTEGLDGESYNLLGPVVKPLQSLFNKLFIRRGQTHVHVIGDLVRATLFVDDKESLRRIVEKIETTFPNITGRQFRQPDSFGSLVEFLSYVHETLKFAPNSTEVLPYRFKVNSSQKGKREPLWYNLNFFRQVPEYHRVGQSEMFVACELQIGLSSEINSYRQVHDAYERDRILSNQSLLKHYEEYIVSAKKKTNGDDDDDDGNDNGTTEGKYQLLSRGVVVSDRTERLNTNYCSDDDFAMIEKVLFGRVATEVLVPCIDEANNKNDDDDDDVNNTNNKILFFESGPYSLRDDHATAAAGTTTVERLCINNRSVNWHTSVNKTQPNRSKIIAGPYRLSTTKKNNNNQHQHHHQTKRNECCYYVDSFSLIDLDEFHGTVGLYAYVGPCYMVQIACCDIRGTSKTTTATTTSSSSMASASSASECRHVVVESGGRNLTFLEQVCPVPLGTTAIVVIAHGYIMEGFSFRNIQISIREFDIVSD